MKKAALLLLIFCSFGFNTADPEPKFNEQLQSITFDKLEGLNNELSSTDSFFFNLLAKERNTIFYRYKIKNYYFYTKSVDIRDTSFDFELDCFDEKKKSGFDSRYNKFIKQEPLAPTDSAFAFYYLTTDEKATKEEDEKAINQAKNKYKKRYALSYFINASKDIPEIQIRFELPNKDIPITKVKHFLVACKNKDF